MADSAAASTPAPPAAAARSILGLWGRVAVAVVLLGGSAGARFWQARRVDQVIRDGRTPPFALAQLPLNLGSWIGNNEPLDPQIARAAGCTDHAFRSYYNKRTGVKLGVIVLYGPSTDVYIHSPDNCYPAAGYMQVGASDVRVVPVGRDGKTRIPFSAQIFSKGEGGQVDRQEVYCTWRYYDRWTPFMLVQSKQVERIPGMFKVHVTRRVGENELAEVGNPSEALLAELMPELNRLLAEAAARRAKTTQRAAAVSQTRGTVVR